MGLRRVGRTKDDPGPLVMMFSQIISLKLLKNIHFFGLHSYIFVFLTVSQAKVKVHPSGETVKIEVK